MDWIKTLILFISVSNSIYMYIYMYMYTISTCTYLSIYLYAYTCIHMAVRNTEASITAWAVALELVACRKLFGATESRDKPETHMLSPPYTNPYSTQIHAHTHTPAHTLSLSLSVYIYIT